ncbi:MULTISPECIES: ExbD/TolR family protein [Marinobacter]|uniref:Biopolymer transporter ExbD n=1 Tax=Marinobacter suaedae TaxID=3057675 RepID=A0ABT8VY67_9GAMM|nr:MULTISPECIES: biopolymer transporter ExbD [unclassified Marinobacter]MBZ2169073.1 biopolymer transporter ExbD [Marinobacter sp. F4216]MDO3720942.1 biopolymer transporter ExbD [Marinobacter sp. chi1]
MFSKRREMEEADIDITAFMNLMIVLVPVLLMSMVFNHISILELNLPDLTGAQTASAEENRQLEVVIRESGIEVYYPSGNLVKTIAKKEATDEKDARHDFNQLSEVLQEIKRRLNAKNIAKKDVLLMSEPGVSYQSLVSTMDTVRSAKTVVVAEAVEVELFPDISLGDAPKKGGKS